MCNVISLKYHLQTFTNMTSTIRNWSEYNAGLKHRGSLTFWVDEAIAEAWYNRTLSGKPGASDEYSDLAIITFVTLKSVYHQAGRQTQGLLESLFALMHIELDVPDHSSVSRRMGRLTIPLPVVPTSGPVHIVVDSTGVKVYGEGEWKTRQHGVSKRRTWRKLHLGINEETGEIVAAVVTTNDVHDAQVLGDLLEQIEGDIEQVTTDGAYDHRHCYEEISQHQAKAVIPPRKDSVIWQHGNCNSPPHPRDENLRYIRKHGRKKWKRDANYHRRSLAETAMFRFKAIFGGKVRSRKFENQAVELLLQCAALNRMNQIAKPDSVWVAD
jgi:Transposase DDE domain